MAWSKNQLASKLRQIYPEIGSYDIDLRMDFDPARGAWIITFHKGDRLLQTFLDSRDADACMDGDRCVYLGVQIGQFVRNFEACA